MARIKSDEVLEQDRRIGQCIGAGMSVEQTAAHIGVHPNTVRNHLDGSNRQFIAKVKAEVEAVLAVTFAKKVADLEAKTEKRASLKETKEAIRQEVYDKLLLKLKTEIPDELFVKLSRTALEFTDEKPAQTQKRISEHTENVNVTVSGEVLDRFDRLAGKLGFPQLSGGLPIIDVPVGSAERD